jgi:DNA-binding transcriptional MerR regulator
MIEYLDEHEIEELSKHYKSGITSSQVITIFRDKGVRFSEATFRKYVQLGLLPRSRRVSAGSGRHRGSKGIYSGRVIKNINDIKRMMSEGLTLDDISRASQKYAREIRGIDSGLQQIFKTMSTEIDGPRFDLSLKPMVETEIENAKESARQLIGKLEDIEKTLTRPRTTL